MNGKPRAQRELAIEIMSYFLRNPNAADDLHGIAGFRLLDEAIYRHVAHVSDALEWLVSVGWLIKMESTSSDPIFSLNAAARREAEEFVAGRSRPGHDADRIETKPSS
ncbi:MAG: hypothetical protein ACRD2N_00710 [Vicinamibacterales bacterium]